MHFGQDQHWAPLDGQPDRLRHAFDVFKVFALNKYVAFLNTVGGGLLPTAFVQVNSIGSPRLDKATAISIGFPHDVLALDPVHAITFCGVGDRIKA
jgi:hypothetical protein